MKEIILFTLICVIGVEYSFSQCDSWTQKTDFGGTARVGAFNFVINGRAYVGAGYEKACGCSTKDVWEYDPIANSWSQKADFGGTARRYSTSFAIGSKGYTGIGLDDNGNRLADFWEYDPGNNVWTEKTNFGGGIRSEAAGFSVNGLGYVGTGTNGSIRFKDFWEYNPANNTWTQKTDLGSMARSSAVSMTIGDKGYIGTGVTDALNNLKDFWEYDPSTDSWTQKTSLGGVPRNTAIGVSICNKGYIATGYNGGRLDDFWEYDAVMDTWTQRSNFGGGARRYMFGFSINGKVYMGAGNESSTLYQKDLWEYTPIGPVINGDTLTDLLCNGDTSGSISVDASGCGILYYSIDGGTTFSNNNGIFSGLGAGTYDIIVKDPFNCSIVGSSLTIGAPQPLLVDSISIVDPLCNGDGNGELWLGASGGTGVLTYSIDGGVTFLPNNGVFANLIAGSYSIDLMDANSCALSAGMVMLTDPDALNGSLFSTPDSGSGSGTATAVGIGGTPPYQYTWTPSGQTGDSVSALSAGSYTVIILDTNGCFFIDSVNIGIYTSMDQLFNDESITVHPNPTHDNVYIAFKKTLTENVYIRVLNLMGEQVMEKKVLYDGDVLNLEELKKGLYFIQMQHGTSLVSKKVTLY